MLRVTIDGVMHDLDAGLSILDGDAQPSGSTSRRSATIRVSTPSGACRVCVVSVDGRARPVTACTTPVVDGMVVETATRELEALRSELLRMLVRALPGRGEPGAPRETPFARLLRRYDVEHGAAHADARRRGTRRTRTSVST